MHSFESTLVDCLRRRAAERRLSAAQSEDSSARILLAEAAEFEALAQVLQSQELAEAIPPLLPAKPRDIFK